MTPAELREQAAQIAREAHAASARGEDRSAFVLSAQAYFLEALATEIEARAVARNQPLQPADKVVTVTSKPMLSPEHRVAISKGRSKRGDELAQLARAKGFSLRGLAEAAGVGWTLMALARKGTKAMPGAAADEIARLVGYPKTRWKRLS